MAVKFNVNFSGDADVQPLISGEKRESLLGLSQLAKALASGTDTGDWTLSCRTSAVAATGLITMTGLPVADETVTVCNVVFTAKASAATATEFTIGASADATIVNLVAKLNAHTTVSKYLSAARTSSGEATLTALVPGVVGNALQLSENATNTAVTAFAAGAETSFSFSF